MFKRIYYSEYIILFFLCFIFYTAMHYYSTSALEGVKTIHIVRNVMLLRTIFCVAFAIFLGFIGVKMTGHTWPAALVHGVAVMSMLAMDFSLKELLADWMLVLIIVSVTSSITALAGGLTLGYYWLRSRRRL